MVDQDRAGRGTHDPLGDAAQEQAFDATQTSAPHHDEVDALVAGVFGDAAMRRAALQHALILHRKLGILDEALEGSFGIGGVVLFHFRQRQIRRQCQRLKRHVDRQAGTKPRSHIARIAHSRRRVLRQIHRRQNALDRRRIAAFLGDEHMTVRLAQHAVGLATQEGHAYILVGMLPHHDEIGAFVVGVIQDMRRGITTTGNDPHDTDIVLVARRTDPGPQGAVTQQFGGGVVNAKGGGYHALHGRAHMQHVDLGVIASRQLHRRSEGSFRDVR